MRSYTEPRLSLSCIFQYVAGHRFRDRGPGPSQRELRCSSRVTFIFAIALLRRAIASCAQACLESGYRPLTPGLDTIYQAPLDESLSSNLIDHAASCLYGLGTLLRDYPYQLCIRLPPLTPGHDPIEEHLLEPCDNVADSRVLFDNSEFYRG